MESMCNMRFNANMKAVCPMMACPMMYMRQVNINPMMGMKPACMNYMYMNTLVGNNHRLQTKPTKGYPSVYSNSFMESPNLFYMEMKPVSIEEIKD